MLYFSQKKYINISHARRPYVPDNCVKGWNHLAVNCAKTYRNHLLNMLLKWVEIILRKIWHTKVVIRRHKLKTENTMDKIKKTNDDPQNTINWATWSSCKPRLNSGTPVMTSSSCSTSGTRCATNLVVSHVQAKSSSKGNMYIFKMALTTVHRL